ncbi:1,4-alpha-glucan branching enzyme GlgB [Burkholderiales bacterium GJ-E10]|nr:1,4-alpha-glucan branching enzyme GlgB [Burkholderiales bacterium GJ-E10]
MNVNVYSIVLLLGGAIIFAPPAMCGAVVHDSPQGARMVARILRRAPYAGDAELAAATFLIVVRTINAPPSVTATDFDAPTVRFGMPKRFLDLFLRMSGAGHKSSKYGGS